MPAADEIRVGLVGLGAVCEGVHYPGFSRIPGVQIGAICDSNADLVQKRALDWGIPLAFSEYGEFLSKSGVDAVAIATPNVRHCDQVHQALDANCHVICEKPLGMNFAEAIEMRLAAERSRKRHMVAFTYRRVPGMKYLKRLIHEGTLGVVRHARFQRLQDWGEFSIGWRQYKDQAGYGELGDMGIHRIDFSEDLLGPIAAVCAAQKRVIDRDQTPEGSPCPAQDLEDWVAWMAEFEAGATGVFEMGKLAKGRGPGGEHDIAEINGSEASAVYQLHTPHQILFARRGEDYQPRAVPPELLVQSGSPRNPAEGDPHWTFRYDQAWEFISAIREGRPCEPSFWHGVRAQRVADSIIKAAKSRRWVDIAAGID